MSREVLLETWWESNEFGKLAQERMTRMFGTTATTIVVSKAIDSLISHGQALVGLITELEEKLNDDPGYRGKRNVVEAPDTSGDQRDPQASGTGEGPEAPDTDGGSGRDSDDSAESPTGSDSTGSAEAGGSKGGNGQSSAD